jgi:hypothetical protein
MVANLDPAVFYHIILTLENVVTAVNYYSIINTLAPGTIFTTLFFITYEWAL